jgi:hypothetical protein
MNNSFLEWNAAAAPRRPCSLNRFNAGIFQEIFEPRKKKTSPRASLLRSHRLRGISRCGFQLAIRTGGKFFTQSDSWLKFPHIAGNARLLPVV